VLEVRHGQFAQGAIDRLAEAQAGVVGFRDGAPAAALTEDRQNMVIITDGFKIEQ